jgi:hypothetical protein
MRNYHSLCLGLLFISQAACADMLDQGFSLVYEVYHNNTYLGVSQNTLKKLNNGQWEYRAEVEPRGFFSLFLSDRITEISRFSRNANLIRPVYYFRHHRKSDHDRQKYEINFDWDKKQLVNTSENRQLDLPDFTQDLLSFQLYLMQKLQQSPNFKTIAVPIATHTDVYVYNLVNKGESKTEVPLGSYPAIQLESEEHDGDRYVLWCVKELEYLPVKIQKIDHDGDIVTLNLTTMVKNP